ncbi:PH domain-containing protein [Taklimakanibacter lacteus]|uniref:PH domain-containing protein n=1 Tax=Taklimakanibacter lacteus TaxID=2268456 RepID=UPI000E67325C
MAGDPLPIVFKGTSRLKLILLAFGIALIGIGIMMIFDQDGGLVGPAGPFRQQTHPSAVGWMVCGTGLAFTVLALVYLARDCPRLELNDEGILYSRCLGTTRIAWGELDRAELRRHTETRGIGAEIDYLMLVATDGREVVISGPVAPTNAQVAQLHETITRLAAGFCPTRPVR